MRRPPALALGVMHHEGDKLNLTNLAYPQPHKKQPMRSAQNPRSASVVFLQPHAGVVKQDLEKPAHPPHRIVILKIHNIFLLLQTNLSV